MSLKDSLPESSVDGCVIDFAGIQEILPHRYPMLYVDKVIEYTAKETIVAQKNVTFNEPFFMGHFPNDPVMPGVVQIEAMAQVGCILMYLSYEEESEGKRPAFMGVSEAKFRKPVRPGDVLTIKAKIEKYRRGIGVITAEVYRGDVLVSNASLTATMV